jgi:orotidine-5'-phosphate decarboxylase
LKAGTLASIKRIKLYDIFNVNTHTYYQGPWVADCRTYDIPETIVALIRSLSVYCVAITLSPRGGRKMIQMAEQAARKKNIRILWFTL